MFRIKSLIICLCVFSSFLGFSQNEDTEKTTNKPRYFAIGGLNISNATGDDVGTVDSRFSFAIGFGAEFLIKEKWSFVPEIIYSQQGFKSDILAFGSGFDPLIPEVVEEGVVFSQDYILIPLKIHYNPSQNFYVFAGPQVGLLINEGLSTNNFRQEDVIGASTAPIYFSGLVGAGFKFSDKLGVRASYQFGISRMFKDLEIPEDNFNQAQTLKFKAYSSVYNISLVYSF